MADDTPGLAKRPRKKPTHPWPPRTCEYCKNEYKPRAFQQRWCTDCGYDKATRARLANYGSPHPTEPALAAITGRRTRTCIVCNERFTYEFVGGSPRKYCDAHAPASSRKRHKEARGRAHRCTTCELAVYAVGDDGGCFRHSAQTHTKRSCRVCGGQFDTPLRQPLTYCSKVCRRNRPKYLNEDRDCKFCGDRFTPEHPPQRYCAACVTSKTERGRVAKYGAPRSDVEKLKARHDGLCWLCRKKPGRCVDHCHATGRLRGWLCVGCNTALHYVERPGWWDEALAYLADIDTSAGLQLRWLIPS
jgi:hypothetical protein